MRMIGFVLIVFSSLIFGVNHVASRKERIDTLSSFASMLELLKAELNSSLCSIPELLERIALKIDGPAQSFIKILKLNFSVLGEKSFSAIWEESLVACNTDLAENELDSLCSLGNVLGKYTLETQNRALDECISLLRQSERNASFDFPQIKRLSIGVSVSAGLLLGILLI